MDRIALSVPDVGIILAYLILLLVIGFSGSRDKISSTENYLLAGRRLSLPAFTATLVATWYGGILGIGEFTYGFGILSWMTQGLPYYIFAIVFALLLAPRIQKSRQFTIPDLLYNRHGKSSGLFGSILIFILVTPAPHFLMTSLLFSAFFGIPFWVAFLVTTVFSTIYVLRGGFRAVVRTDIFQFLLMFAGFFIVVVSAFSQFGGIRFLRAHLPPAHFDPTGGMGYQYLVVWFFIAFWTFVDPGFYQRCFAARTPQTARYGILLSVLFWIVFDFLTTATGLYARALLSGIEPLMSFPRIGEFLLPPVFRGLFFVGLLATIMSTLDSNSFLSATTFGRDFIWRLTGTQRIKSATQIGLIVTIGLSAVLVFFIPSVVKMWFVLGTVIIPSLLIPLIAGFFPAMSLSRPGAFLTMLITALMTLTWYAIGILRGSFDEPLFPLSVQPFFIGLCCSIGLYAVDRGLQLHRHRHPQKSS